MKVINAYEAFDGKVFSDYDECYNYEIEQIIGSITDEDIVMFDYFGDKIENLIDGFDDAVYIHCKTVTGINFLQALKDRTGYDDIPERIGIYRWDDNNEEWITPQEDINNLNEKWEVFTDTIAELVK